MSPDKRPVGKPRQELLKQNELVDIKISLTKKKLAKRLKESDRTENDFRIVLRLRFRDQFCGKNEFLVSISNKCWDSADPAAELKSQTIEALERRFTKHIDNGEQTKDDQKMMDMAILPDFMWGFLWSTVELQCFKEMKSAQNISEATA